MLIVNADDWGRSRSETDIILKCCSQGRVTAVSAMVFMEDSDRAAAVAKDAGLDVGLHLNFSQPFTGRAASEALERSHARIVRFLSRSKYALLMYHPGLRKEFRSGYQAQVEEFELLYGKPPSHIDGHQHLHLCTNLLLDPCLPRGAIVRRNFSFGPGEKGALNRCYRRVVDAALARRYRMTDYFFALSRSLCLNSLDRVYAMAKAATVELMTHPIVGREQGYLMSEAHARSLQAIPIGGFSEWRS
jgi:chitin disaccharide deacetylase